MADIQQKKPVGVIGAGSFGTAIAELLAQKTEVIQYSRNPELVASINEKHYNFGLERELPKNIIATNSLEEVAKKCTLIFPIVPSDSFRDMMRNLSPFLHPYHILIHGTKGFDIKNLTEADLDTQKITRNDVSTMSEIIREESVVVRVGCLSGPNLATEIMEGQPTATVIASKFNEVILAGKDALNSNNFQVFGTKEILGAELAGALKNIIAIGSGALAGMGLGKNIQSLLINRGLIEMIYYGQAMGASPKAFVGTAGIGDLVCTATSENSRNFTFGSRLGRGESVEEIKKTMPELAEGVRALNIAKHLADHYNLHVPITQMLHRIVHKGFDAKKAIELLMKYPYYVDVDFM